MAIVHLKHPNITHLHELSLPCILVSASLSEQRASQLCTCAAEATKALCFSLCVSAGAISEGQVVAQAWILLLAGIATAYGLDRWAGHEVPTLTGLAIFGALISYVYSAPPLKLKQSGWIGNYALGSSYIALPWWAGQVIFVFLVAS